MLSPSFTGDTKYGLSIVNVGVRSSFGTLQSHL